MNRGVTELHEEPLGPLPGLFVVEGLARPPGVPQKDAPTPCMHVLLGGAQEGARDALAALAGMDDEEAADRPRRGLGGKPTVHGQARQLGHGLVRRELHPPDDGVAGGTVDRDEPACRRIARAHGGGLLGEVLLGPMRAPIEPVVLRTGEVPVAAEAGGRSGLEEPGEAIDVRGRERLDLDHERAPSHAEASVNMVVSRSAGAMIWSPTGKPAAVGAHGTLIAGSPARLAGSV